MEIKLRRQKLKVSFKQPEGVLILKDVEEQVRKSFVEHEEEAIKGKPRVLRD